MVDQLRNDFIRAPGFIRFGPELMGNTESINNIASVLKQYLRELPDPLLPPHLLTLLRRVLDKGADRPNIREELVQSICSVSPQHAAVISRLFRHLHEVAGRHQVNRMTPANLATCFAPTLTAMDPALDLVAQTMYAWAWTCVVSSFRCYLLHAVLLFG